MSVAHSVRRFEVFIRATGFIAPSAPGQRIPAAAGLAMLSRNDASINGKTLILVKHFFCGLARFRLYTSSGIVAVFTANLAVLHMRCIPPPYGEHTMQTGVSSKPRRTILLSFKHITKNGHEHYAKSIAQQKARD